MAEASASSGGILITETYGDVVVLRLNRPECRNAMDVALSREFCTAVTRWQDKARAIVITGTDPGFCSGDDVRVGADWRNVAPFTATVAQAEIPVIAAVNGPAVTGGLELALAADFIIGSERAVFADTHLRMGMYASREAMLGLRSRIGPTWTREMLLTSEYVDAQTALRIGLMNHLVAHEELIAFAVAKATSIASANPKHVRSMRREWVATEGLPLAQALPLHNEYARPFYDDANSFEDPAMREQLFRWLHGNQDG
jgi:enoyl-CoA hydratase